MPVTPSKYTPHGVDNAEKGKVANDNASADFVAVPIALPENQTKVAFFYDRAVLASALVNAQDLNSNFSLQDAANVMNNALLTPLPSNRLDDSTYGLAEQHRWLSFPTDTKQTPPYKTKQDWNFLMFSPFTYYKCDLEVTLSLNSSDLQITLVIGKRRKHKEIPILFGFVGRCLFCVSRERQPSVLFRKTIR